MAAFFVHRLRKAQATPPYEAAPELGHYAANHKDYDQAEIKPLVPTNNYELATTRANEINLSAPRHELASPPAELAGTRFNEHMQDASRPPQQGSFYSGEDGPSM
jgi:hypothetical protein